MADATSSIPEHMRDEERSARRWNSACALGAITLFAGLLLVLPAVLYYTGEPLNARTWENIGRYAAMSVRDPMGPFAYLLFDRNSPVPIPVVLAGTLVCLGIAGAIAFAMMQANPFRAALMIHGDARFANEADLMRMDQGKQVGPSGTFLNLGRMGKHDIRLIETLSVMLVAPPGTGKTTRFIIPALLETNHSSFIVHDPKPELHEICSGWRQKVGPTFELNWAKLDRPEQGVWYPCFNFLDQRVVPPDVSERDTFIDALAKTLIPDKEGSGEKYFTNKGRAALVGFTQFIVAKINDRTDEERYEGLNERWHGKQASLPMLVDWLTSAQREALKNADTSNPQADPFRPFMQQVIDEAVNHKYPDRCVLELQPLVAMAPNERSGVLGTMDEGLLPFKNAAVIERTATSDFVPADLRGRVKPATLERLGLDHYPVTREEWEGVGPKLSKEDWEPVTVFISINQADAQAFETVTSLFFEVCSRTLISYGPGEVSNLGAQLGPFSCCALMDELVKMGRCDAVVDGPDLGRSKRMYYVLVSQDLAQIKRRYSEDQREIILTTTAVKILLPQNSAKTIRDLADMVGDTTVKRYSTSRTVGLKKDTWSGNRSESLDKVRFLGVNTLGAMPEGKHILVVQNWMHRPIRCDSAVYYKDPELLKRVWNPHTGKGLRPSGPLPEYNVRERRARAAAREREEALAREALRRRYHLPVEFLADTPGRGP